MHKNAIGIVRETYNHWERRVPLTPAHVRRLIKEKNLKVFIQPCDKRIFANSEYTKAGAIVQEDLSPASAILGVKQVPNGSLMPNKTYCFFSHTIKAQPENMALLDEALEKKVRLLDYECIAKCDGGSKLVRQVAFGKFAGRAGMIDSLRMTGESLLINHGISTPFLNISAAYMYDSYEKALQEVEKVGSLIKESQMFIDNPMLFCFTGNGKVTTGALEVFHKLQPEMKDLESLSNFYNPQSLKSNQHSIIGCQLQKKHLVAHRDGAEFNENEYAEFPERFKGNFSKNQVISKHCQVLMNGIYWDRRFPRVVSKRSIHDLEALHCIGDLSCDIEGSIEQLEHTTLIEDPFIRVPVSENKKLYLLGVDILPSELPKESSQYFGDQLFDYIEPLCGDSTDLPDSLARALIAEEGSLTTGFQYITDLRNEREREDELNAKGFSSGDAKNKAVGYYKMYGHLFDTQVINRVMDEVENDNGQLNMIECIVKPGKQTSALLRIQLPGDEKLARLERKLEAIIAKVSNKDETQGVQLVKLDNSEDSTHKASPIAIPKKQTARGFSTSASVQKRVSVFGSGMMSFPALEYLTRDPTVTVSLSSNSDSELESAKTFIERTHNRQNLELHNMDVTDGDKVASLARSSDVCLSLLPTTFHHHVINSCLNNSIDLVTASYVDHSQDITKLDATLKQSNTVFLMELGVDPGIDHMSAMLLLDDIRASGGKITSFKSFCGGLPKLEPDRFKQNILNYKFSWSPKGVIRALGNDAAFLEKGKHQTIPSSELLRSVKDFDMANDAAGFDMEYLANRDSLKYQSAYGLDDCESIYRGTLRYRGFSSHMERIRVMGFLSETMSNMDALENSASFSFDSPEFASFFQEFEKYAREQPADKNAADVFCDYLQQTLVYEAGERDAIFMEHRVTYLDAENNEKETGSQLILYGDDTYSAMAKTVGVSAAIGCEQILQDKNSSKVLKEGGLLIPIGKELYVPILKKLENEGVMFSHF